MRSALPRRLEVPARVLLALAALALIGYAVLRGATYSNDFKNPFRVARVFWQTGVLDIRSEPRYPPTARVLLAPLAALPIAGAAAVWAGLSVAGLLAMPRLLGRLSGVPVRAQVLSWLAVLVFVIDALVLGQSDPVNIALVTAGLVLAREARPALGMGLIGLAAMVKVLPLAFGAVLVARGRLRGALLGALLVLAMGAGLLATAGWRAGAVSMVEWYRGLRDAEGPWGLVATRNSLRENNESLPVVLARTFGDLDPELARNAVSLARLPLRAVWAAWLAILAAMSLTWVWCAWHARRAPPGRAWLAMYALTAGLVLAATPIAWPHYFLWLLPAALFVSARRRLLLAVAAVGALGMMIAPLRGLGCHTALALLLFAVVAHDLVRGAPADRPATGNYRTA